jgi:hypothetical protein
MSKTKNKKVSSSSDFRTTISMDFGANILVDAFSDENGRPMATIKVNDGRHDGRPWGCSGIIKLETSDAVTLHKIAEALLDAAERIDNINRERFLPISKRVSEKKRRIAGN